MWLQKRGKHAARQGLAEKRLRAMGQRQRRTLANRAREMKVKSYSAKKFLSKIGRHAAKRATVIGCTIRHYFRLVIVLYNITLWTHCVNCVKIIRISTHQAEVFLRGLGQTHAKRLATSAKREKFAADLRIRREEALDYLNQLAQFGLQQCRAGKYLRDIGQHWVKTFKVQTEAKATLRKLADTARKRASAELWCREEGEKAREYIKVMMMLEKQKQKEKKKPKKKKPPPLTPRKEKRDKFKRIRAKLGTAMRLAKVGKDHRISEVERMKTQMLMMAKIKRFRNRISDADVLRNHPVHDVKPLPDAVTIKALNFNENIQVQNTKICDYLLRNLPSL